MSIVHDQRRTTGSLPESLVKKLWEPETIAERLKTKAEKVRHPAHGESSSFPIGPEGELRLETYPETRSARLVGTNAEINLYRLDRAPSEAVGEKTAVVSR